MEKTLLIFGITGDLARKKIIPALYSLYQTNKLKNVRLVGTSRRPFSQAEFIDFISEQISKSDPLIDRQEIEEFGKSFEFVSGDFGDASLYTSLSTLLKQNAQTNLSVYLSVFPSFYETIIQNLFTHINSFFDEKTIQIVVEKPIGNNLESAKKIENLLSVYFSEEQIYRADHYLHKEILNQIELVKNSSFLQNTWNNKSIESIRIVTLEQEGLEKRGVFYEEVGTLLDVVQNHILALLTKILQNKKGLPLDWVNQTVVDVFRAQYLQYRQIEGVNPNSTIETYVQINSVLQGINWEGTKLQIEAGKSMPKNSKFIEMNYFDGTKLVFDFTNSNKTILKLQDREIQLYVTSENARFVGEYMSLIEDVLDKKQSNFVSKVALFKFWEFIDPIKSSFTNNQVPLSIYEANTWPSKNTDNSPKKHSIGFIGLGKMGIGIATQLVELGHNVVVWNRSKEKSIEFSKQNNSQYAVEIEELVSKLPEKKIIWLMLPSGEPTEEMILQTLPKFLSAGDIIVDGSNSLYKDTLRRAEELKKHGIELVDAAVSGGPYGARNGACIMTGGKKEIVETLQQIFVDICTPGGYLYAGNIGAGHFVKMVHNGIEYGMMQAIAEGFEVLKSSKFNLDLKEISKLYNFGSVIESRLIGWLYESFAVHGTDLKEISGSVSHLGEGLWTIQTAKELGVDVEIIEKSLQFRLDSEINPSYAGKILSALRNSFGGHSINEKDEQKD